MSKVKKIEREEKRVYKNGEIRTKMKEVKRREGRSEVRKIKHVRRKRRRRRSRRRRVV